MYKQILFIKLKAGVSPKTPDVRRWPDQILRMTHAQDMYAGARRFLLVI